MVKSTYPKIKDTFPHKDQEWLESSTRKFLYSSLPADLKNWENKSTEERDEIIEKRNIMEFLDDFSEKIPSAMLQGEALRKFFDSLFGG